MAETIKEYGVLLGFKLDEPGLNRFNLALGKVTSQFTALGLVTGEVTFKVAEAITQVARQFETLYYTSQRTGETVAGLTQVSFAAKQIGLTSEQARAAVENFSASLRNNPGLKGLLGNLGVGPGSPLQQLQQLVDNLKNQPYFIASRYAQLFGLDEQTFRMLSLNLERLRQEEADTAKAQREAGVDVDVLAKKSTEFGRALNRLERDFNILGNSIWQHFITPAKAAVEWMDSLVRATAKAFSLSARDAADIAATTSDAFQLDMLDTNSATRKGPFTSDVVRGFLSRQRARAARPGSPAARVDAGYVMRYFEDRGWSPQAAAAIVANVDRESGFNPREFNPAGGGTGAFGLFQWRGSRKQDFARLFGKPIEQSSPQEQLAFAEWELTNSQSGVGNALRFGRNARELGMLFSRDFERHGNAAEDAARGRFAERLLVNNTTTINVQGGSTPGDTARAVASEQGRVNGDLVRNLAGAVR